MESNNRKLVAFAFLILAIFIIVNTNADKSVVVNTRLFSLFLLPELTRDAFSSWENFKMFLVAKMVFDPTFKWVLLGVIASVSLLIFFLISKRKRDRRSFEFEEILSQVSLVLEETVDTGKRDKNGRVIFEDVKIMPDIDLTDVETDNSFLIRNVHDKLKRPLREYLDGLLILLKEAGYIDIEKGMIEDTGFPGQYKVILFSPDFIKRQRLESVFNKANLFFKETVGERARLIYPKITEKENGNLIVDVSRVNITRTQIEGALNIISKEFEKKYLFVTEINNSTYEIHCEKPAHLLIPKGQSIIANFDTWMDGPVEILKEKWAKEKQFYWYFGDLGDSSYSLDHNELIISGDDLVHAMIIGTTGSGKSESAKSICSTLQAAYGSSLEVYYANGAQSTDLDSLCLSYSPIGKEAAKPYGTSPDEMLSRLLHILSNADSIKEQRDLLYKEATEQTGIECKKISEYRKITGNDIPEILIVIDEFAGYSILFDYDANVNNVGSVAYYLQIGFSQYRKFGIHFLLATQEMRAKSIPRRLVSNIKGGLVMNVSETDYKYMLDLDFNLEGLDPTSLSKGDGIFFSNSIRCKLTNKSRIPVSMPFIGADTMELIDLIGHKIDPKKKKEYDTAILTLDEKDLNQGGFEGKPKKLQLAIEKCCLLREKWIIIKKENPTHRIFNLYARHNDTGGAGQEQGKSIRIAFATVEDVLSPNFEERLDREELIETDLTIYFILGKCTPKNMDDLRAILESDKSTLCLFQSDFTSTIRQAYELYMSKDDAEVFNKLLNSIEFRNRLKIKKELDELYSSKISPSVVNVGILNRIRKEEGASKKGESFEDLFLAMELADGHDSIHGRELALKGIVNLKLANAQADGGLDVVRWIDREKKICRGFQLKNMVSKSASTDVVDKMVKTRDLYTELGLTFESFFLITTGDVTRQAREEAEKLGFIVVNGKQLDSIILSMGAKAKVKIEDFDPKRAENLALEDGPLLRDISLDAEVISKEEIKSKFKPKDISVVPIAKEIQNIDGEKDDKVVEPLDVVKEEPAKTDPPIKVEAKTEPIQKINESQKLADRILSKTKQLGVKYPNRSVFLEDYNKLLESKDNPQQKRLLFNELAYEFLKLNGYDVKRVVDIENMPKEIVKTFPFVYFIDDKRIGVVSVKNNQTRGIGTGEAEAIKEGLEVIRNAGYSIARKELYLSGTCFAAARKDLENEGFTVYDGEAYVEEIKKAYARLEIVEGSKT